MQWLRSFAALALLCGAVMTLLPAGGIRKTAALVMGLLITLSWVDSLRELPMLPERFARPATLLTETAAASAGTEDYASQLSRSISEICGTSIRVKLDQSGCVTAVDLPEGCGDDVRRRCCEALGISEKLIISETGGR